MDKPLNDEPGEFKYSSEDNRKTKNRKATQAVSFPAPPDKVEKPLFKWSAPDSFSAKKSAKWYLALSAITLVVSAGIYLLIKDKITTAVILVSGALIGLYGAKKPRIVNYEMNEGGFSVNGRYYELSSYRSFAVINHGTGYSITLTPFKRFMPYMYIYCENNVKPEIESLLSEILPSETTPGDTIDKFLRKVGF